MNGWQAIRKLVSEYTFDTVLDVCCGTGDATAYFRAHGKTVTPVDHRGDVPGMVRSLYQDHDFAPHDCTWCCHALEHQLNVNAFLRKIGRETKEGGIICVTVPPLKHAIVGGHITLWNAGLLAYNLVLAGLDCSGIRIKQYGYNISVILQRRAIELPDDLLFDKGDLEKLRAYLPSFVRHGSDGSVREYNWGS